MNEKKEEWRKMAKTHKIKITKIETENIKI